MVWWVDEAAAVRVINQNLPTSRLFREPKIIDQFMMIWIQNAGTGNIWWDEKAGSSVVPRPNFVETIGID